MRYWVGCTIKVINTDLSCDIQIGHRRRKGQEIRITDWEKIAGRLDLGNDYGLWFYFAPVKKTEGIVLFSRKERNDPRIYFPENLLVTLLGTPERFAEKLSCGEYFGGEGLLNLTNEKVKWEMWYPCG